MALAMILKHAVYNTGQICHGMRLEALLGSLPSAAAIAYLVIVPSVCLNIPALVLLTVSAKVRALTSQAIVLGPDRSFP